MVRLLSFLVRLIFVLCVGSILPLFVAWQAFLVGVNEGVIAFLLVCGIGILCLVGSIALHELGHLITGLLLGLSFEQFTVSFFEVARQNGRMRLRFNTAWFRPAASVQCVVPESPSGALRWAAMVAAGPIANMTLALACFLTASWHNPGPTYSVANIERVGWREVGFLFPKDLATACLTIAALVNLYFGTGSLMPGRGKVYVTDGAQLVDLWRFHRALSQLGYPSQAAILIRAALSEIRTRRGGEIAEKRLHVSAKEFCAYLLTARGEATPSVLRSCNLRTSEDVGRVMFALVRAGILRRQESDSEADFSGLFVLDP